MHLTCVYTIHMHLVQKYIHCVKKTPTGISLYISVENVQISTKISGNVYKETSIPSMKKLDILCYWWRQVTSYFCICKLWVLPQIYTLYNYNYGFYRWKQTVLIKCLWKPIIYKHGNIHGNMSSPWHHREQRLYFSPMEYLFPAEHFLKILCKSKHFPRRYKRKHEWVFFYLNTV